MTILNESPPTIVIDIGSYACNIGLSTDANPKVIPSIVGTIRKNLSNELNDTFIGEAAQKRRGILTNSYPVKNGIIKNFDDLERILNYAFEHQLNIEPSSHSILVATPQNIDDKQLEKIEKLFFETFRVRSIAFSTQAELATLSSRIKTGVIVDIGDGLTQITPCYENQIIDHAKINFAIAGRSISEEFENKFHNELGSHSFEVSREVKENCCSIRVEDEIESLRYELPDGTFINLNSERSECAEILFNPRLCGVKSEGLHMIIRDVIKKCDETIQTDLFKNILLIGGTSKIEGLKERLKNEIKSIVPLNTKVNVSCCNEEYPSWIGGKIFASLPYFNDFLIRNQ